MADGEKKTIQDGGLDRLGKAFEEGQALVDNCIRDNTDLPSAIKEALKEKIDGLDADDILVLFIYAADFSLRDNGEPHQ